MGSRGDTKRMVAIVLAFLATAALVVAAFGNRWLAVPGAAAENGFGLRQLDVCGKGCTSYSQFELLEEYAAQVQTIIDENKLRQPNEQRAVPRKPWDGWPVVGMITFVALLLGALGLGIAALLAVLGKRPETPVMPTTIALLGIIIAMIGGCVFIAVKPEGFTEGHATDIMMIFAHVGIGWTFLVFAGAIILGLASVFPLNRQIRPIDEELGAASATMSWGTSRDD